MQNNNMNKKASWMKPSKFRRTAPVDKYLAAVTIAMICFGVIMVFSASENYALKNFDDGLHYFKNDLIYAGISMVAIIIVSFIDYRKYEKFSFVFYLMSLLLCCLVFISGFSTSIGDAKRWIYIGSLSFMPSDVLKLGTIMLMSWLLSRHALEKNRSFKTLITVVFVLAITVIPIILQPNRSATMVLAMTILFMYFIGGINLKYFLVLIPVAAGMIAWDLSDPNSYQVGRILSVLNPSADPLGDGWQLTQSLYAVGSGGIFGVGFGQSAQKYGYLADEAHNDFIFAVLSEELGFIGALLVVFAYVFFAYRGLRAASHAKTQYGRFLGYGITFLVSFQAMVNIGVAIGLVPTTGITLPFISYGGSSLLLMSIMAGILLNISRDSA